MAQSKNNPENQRAKLQNPFLIVPFSREDLSGYEIRGGGGKELVPVDAEYRKALKDSLDASEQYLQHQLMDYPSIPSGLILKLRDTGIAKSHRPITLINEAGLIPCGHAHMNEMLVGVNAESIACLKRIILERNTKSIRNNLSAITKIEPWSLARKNPEGIEALKEKGAAIVRLFRYTSEEATVLSVDSVYKQLSDYGCEFEILSLRPGQAVLKLFNLKSVDDSDLESALDHPGIRLVTAEKALYAPVRPVRLATADLESEFPVPDDGLPLVGVFDSGVSPNVEQLSPWVASRDTYVLQPDTDHVHGTAVASLIVASHILNKNHPLMPKTGSLIHDVAGLESAGQDIGVLENRLRSAVSKRRDIKVWNLSLGAPLSCSDQEFSEFGQVLDGLSDEFGVIFVVSSGNYLLTPRRGWPDNTPLDDRISSPGDSVRALTVGSMTHAQTSDTLVEAYCPAPYSRRGPGPVFTPKPDVTHLGGGVHAPWKVGETSTSVLLPTGEVGGNFGTSFSAPIVASLAAHTWAALDGHRELTPSPSMVKALIIHAAQLSSKDFNANERRYFGSGLPQDTITCLYDRDDSFTLVFEVQLIAGAFRWRKAPYPIPESLMEDGKFRGEVIITAAYSPPLDSNAGAEYVRANVELSFGTLSGDRIKGKVPLEREPGVDTYEKAQVQNGGKWAPVKIHRQAFPQGVSGEAWALQAQCSLRAFEPSLTEPIKVAIAVTVRSLDGNPKVHSDGVRAASANNWVTQQLPVRVPVTT